MSFSEMVALTPRLPRRGRGIWYGLAIELIWPLLVLFVRMRMTGREKVPKSGAVLLASNHLSNVDPILLTAYALASGRIPRYLARANLFTAPVIGAVMRSGRHIPVDRGSARAGLALDAARTALADGECVGVYPEGTFTSDPDHWPMRGKSGVARVALATRTPVVPVAQWGPERLLPEGSARPRPWTKVQITCGDPVDLSDLYGKPMTKQVLDEATARIMAAITGLLEGLRGEPAPARELVDRADARRVADVAPEQEPEAERRIAE